MESQAIKIGKNKDSIYVCWKMFDNFIKVKKMKLYTYDYNYIKEILFGYMYFRKEMYNNKKICCMYKTFSSFKSSVNNLMSRNKSILGINTYIRPVNTVFLNYCRPCKILRTLWELQNKYKIERLLS